MARPVSLAWPISLLGAGLFAVLCALNVPYYCGAGGARWSWRMEHGRLRVEHHSEPQRPVSFYVADNSEGLEFAPEWNVRNGTNWMILVPLWMPLTTCLLLGAYARSVARREAP